MLEIAPDGVVGTDSGVIRLSEGNHPTVEATVDGTALTLDSGWCWVATTRSTRTVRVTLPAGVVMLPPASRMLAVLQPDRSTFVSVVSGTVTLDHAGGRTDLPAGTIAHLPMTGEPSTDTASPEEMAADALLTLNLRLDDARAAADHEGGQDSRTG